MLFYVICFTVTLECTPDYKLETYSNTVCTHHCHPLPQPHTSSFAILPDCIRRLWGVIACTMQIWVRVLWEVNEG